MRKGQGMRMKQKGIRAIVAVVIVGVIVGAYLYATQAKRASVEDGVELTEVQQVITKDLEANYPATPREVVKYFNRITTCYYNEKYTDQELYGLVDQARILFDKELQENNPRDTYFSSVRADVLKWQENSKSIVNTSVCDTDEVNYQTIDGDECAYVKASYFVNESKGYSRTSQMYVLRKDEDGRWKILVFYKVKGDSSDE